MAKIKIIGGKPDNVEVFIDGEKLTQPLISLTWRMDCDKFLPVLTMEMYADDSVEIEGPADVGITTKEV